MGATFPRGHILSASSATPGGHILIEDGTIWMYENMLFCGMDASPVQFPTQLLQKLTS